MKTLKKLPKAILVFTEELLKDHGLKGNLFEHPLLGPTGTTQDKNLLQGKNSSLNPLQRRLGRSLAWFIASILSSMPNVRQ